MNISALYMYTYNEIKIKKQWAHFTVGAHASVRCAHVPVSVRSACMCTPCACVCTSVCVCASLSVYCRLQPRHERLHVYSHRAPRTPQAIGVCVCASVRVYCRLQPRHERLHAHSGLQETPLAWQHEVMQDVRSQKF